MPYDCQIKSNLYDIFYYFSQTCEEEVERRPDGHEIRMKKTRIVNKSQTSKCVINRRIEHMEEFAYLGHHKNAWRWSRWYCQEVPWRVPIIQRRFGLRDERLLQAAVPRRDKERVCQQRCRRRSVQLRWSPAKSDLAEFGSVSEVEVPAAHQRQPTVSHLSMVLGFDFRSVSKQSKRDGKVLADNAAHKLDTSQLDAKQTDTYQVRLP